MSLDVYLNNKGANITVVASDDVFVRKEGQTVAISREEWNRQHPGEQPVIFKQEQEQTDEVFHYNITHNLGTMAQAAGLYEALWRPEENGITYAKEIIGTLERGLKELEFDPARYKEFNPKNGWGDYEGLVKFVSAYLQACIAHPDAEIDVSR